MGSIKIAMADDHPMILQGRSLMLEKYTHLSIVLKSTGSHDLLRNLKTMRPDVLLLDIQMPPPAALIYARKSPVVILPFASSP